MRTVAFVQARLGSQRLPGKSMLPVWGTMPLVELVLRRVSAARSLSKVVLLTTTAPRDEELADVAARLGIPAFRGPEDDVLSRFAGALEHHPAEAVVRVCADNPFVEPRALDELVSFFLESQPCDYASNHTPRSGLPDGIGGEVIGAEALRRAASEANQPEDREHVTRFVWRNPERFSLAWAPAPPPPLSHIKLDIDTPDDYRAIRQLADTLPEPGAPLWDRETIQLAWERTTALSAR